MIITKTSFFPTGYAYLTSRSSIQPFICEISDQSLRLVTSNMWAICTNAGLNLSVLAADLLGWRYVSLFMACLMIICFLGLLWLHETPTWLLENKQFDKAVGSLKFYKSDKKSIVDDSAKRKSTANEELGYDGLVELYKAEAEKHEASVPRDEETTNATWM